MFGPALSIQAPPNLSPGVLEQIVAAGINDWGGVSPVTPDFVNPEAPWPHLEQLERWTARAGKVLAERLTIYPRYALDPERWLDARLRPLVLQRIDASGLPRTDPWLTGSSTDAPGAVFDRLPGPPASPAAPALPSNTAGSSTRSYHILERARAGHELAEHEIVAFFEARGPHLGAVFAAADALRREVCGDTVSYVVNRNINYTNICYYRCQFCAFSKGKMSENLRGKPYDLDHAEIVRRTLEAVERGGTEVCLQGGIHPEYTGQTYLDICRAIRAACPEVHIHAFSPLEVWQGAATLGVPLRDFLLALRAAGLATLPGTAAEILDDEVRRVICPDKITTAEWLEVMRTAHGAGFRTTATIMFGHVDRPHHWARHLLRVRRLQQETGGLTEFVPLPFVASEAPLYLKGRARRGPTFREAVLMHAVARLVLHPLVTNIQASWVKMGRAGVLACLRAGANDLGGTLMNESITRAAGAEHGQELPPSEMETLIDGLGRVPRQRTTLYRDAPAERRERAFAAVPLLPVVNLVAHRYERTEAGPAG